MSTLNYSQTLGLCSHSFALSNEKNRTRRVENDKFANQVKSLSLNMKINYLKKLVAFIFISCFLSSSLSIAQSKPPQPSWYVIKIKDIHNWGELEDSEKDAKIRDPNWYIKNSCVPEDLMKALERRNKDPERLTYGVFYEIDDKVTDESGKVQVVQMRATNARYGILSMSWMYFREKSECLKEQQEFKELIITKRNAALEKSNKIRKKYE